ncbi:helix-turn-helix domain-containing protein [Spongisporangium articulatum]|uniref:Helix-turn-helix domain-containing protein n=1 Tax=Spongisporangium articulatum TaxID=3362603 RepID=A0ABW8AR89_9ACTN
MTQERSLADRLETLFRTVHPAGRGEYTNKEVADAIAADGGATISVTYLWQLRNGQRDNPTMHHLEAIAKFFGVPPSYFFDDEAAARLDEQLGVLTALRDANVRGVALRTFGLSPAGVEAVTAMIEQVRRLEGLRDDAEEGSGAPG